MPQSINRINTPLGSTLFAQIPLFAHRVLSELVEANNMHDLAKEGFLIRSAIAIG